MVERAWSRQSELGQQIDLGNHEVVTVKSVNVTNGRIAVAVHAENHGTHGVKNPWLTIVCAGNAQGGADLDVPPGKKGHTLGDSLPAGSYAQDVVELSKSKNCAAPSYVQVGGFYGTKGALVPLPTSLLAQVQPPSDGTAS